MTHRADFLATARGRRAPTHGFVLQARRRADPKTAADAIRIGYTCSKKVGNAVARNRAKRRLREVARAVLPANGHAGWDYVMIGRANSTATRPFADLCEDLIKALGRVHNRSQLP